MILDYPAGAQSHHWHPYKRDAEGDEMEMHREEGNLKAEAGTGEMWPQTQQPEARRHKKWILPKPLERNNPSHTLILDL